jgi:hypothetical protein
MTSIGKSFCEMFHHYSLYVDQYAVKFKMHLPKDENLWEKRAKQPLFGFLLISSLKLLESYKFQRSSE